MRRDQLSSTAISSQKSTSFGFGEQRAPNGDPDSMAWLDRMDQLCHHQQGHSRGTLPVKITALIFFPTSLPVESSQTVGDGLEVWPPSQGRALLGHVVLLCRLNR